MKPISRCLLPPSPAVQRFGPAAGILLLPILLLSACAKPLVLDATLPQQFAEMSCLESCRATKASCDRDARYDYRQCEAGYAGSFRDYRWCLASASHRDDCGYPWWSCAENLYGYCSNRFHECQSNCQSGGY